MPSEEEAMAYSCVTDEETEAQSHEVTCPCSLSLSQHCWAPEPTLLTMSLLPLGCCVAWAMLRTWVVWEALCPFLSLLMKNCEWMRFWLPGNSDLQGSLL